MLDVTRVLALNCFGSTSDDTTDACRMSWCGIEVAVRAVSGAAAFLDQQPFSMGQQAITDRIECFAGCLLAAHRLDADHARRVLNCG
jgi:hypothetical protein